MDHSSEHLHVLLPLAVLHHQALPLVPLLLPLLVQAVRHRQVAAAHQVQAVRHRQAVVLHRVQAAVRHHQAVVHHQVVVLLILGSAQVIQIARIVMTH